MKLFIILILVLFVIPLALAQDTSPPVITVMAVGNDTTIPYTTSQINAQIDFITDENADCRISLSNQSYDGMGTDCFGGQSTLNHNCTSDDLGIDGSKNVFLACKDSVGNSHDTLNNKHLSFTLSTPRPKITSSKPVGVVNSTSVLLGVVTDRIAHCRYKKGSNPGYSQMTDFSMTDVLSHNSTVAGLYAGNQKYYVLCSVDSYVMANPVIVNFTVVIPDSVAPSAITDLRIYNTTSTTVTLAWAAVGDDGDVGNATEYILKFSTSFIKSSNWDDAMTVSGLPAPGEYGDVEFFTVTGLTSGENYYFAIKAKDESGNTGVISNSPRAVLVSQENATVNDKIGNASIGSSLEQENGGIGGESTGNVTPEEEEVLETTISGPSNAPIYIAVGLVIVFVLLIGKWVIGKVHLSKDKDELDISLNKQDLDILGKQYDIPINKLEELRTYIDNCKKERLSDKEIKKELIEQGWDPDLTEVFLNK